MTPQEIDRIECAIRHIKSSLDVDPWACDIAVEAMKRQISSSQSHENDAISRQAAIEDIRTMIPKDAQLDIKWIEMWLMQLPSAQPERETAKFIRWMECKKTADYISYTPHCKCSKCGTEFLIETIKYCYMCGARMER